MKKVSYHKKDFQSQRLRGVSLCEFLQDADSVTQIKKTFVYKVTMVDRVEDDIAKPEIFVIKKSLNQGKQESFRCIIKGTVYIRENRFVYCVKYLHGLLIHLKWKTHVLREYPSVLKT